MSLGICNGCRQLFHIDDAGHCPRCRAIGELLAVVDKLAAWRRTVDVISGNAAADQLAALLDRAELAAKPLRAP